MGLRQPLQFGQARAGRSEFGAPGMVWRLGSCLLLLALQPRQLIHLAAVLRNVGPLLRQLGLLFADLLQQLGIGAHRLAAGAPVLRQFGLQAGNQRIAGRGGQRGCGLRRRTGLITLLRVQGGTQPLAGMAYVHAQFARVAALLYPQQAGHTPVLWPPRPFGGKAKAHALGQPVLGLLAAPALAGGLQVAAFFLQKSLVQAVGLALQHKLQRYRWRCATVALGLQIRGGTGAVPIQKRRANSAHHRAFARTIRPCDDVEPRLQIGQRERCKLAQLRQL